MEDVGSRQVGLRDMRLRGAAATPGTDATRPVRTTFEDDIARLTESLDRDIRSFGVAETPAPARERRVLFAAGPEALATAAIAIGAAAIWLVSALPY